MIVKALTPQSTVKNEMRLLYLPLLHGFADTQTGLEKAFRSHFEVRTFDFIRAHDASNQLVQLCREFKPEIIHAQIQGTNNLDANVWDRIREINPNTIVTQWSGDVRVNAIEEMLRHGAKMDLTLLSSKGQIPLYEQGGCRKVAYWQVAVDREMQFVQQELPWSERRHGIIFCGNHSPSFPDSWKRQSVVQKLSRTFPDFYAFGQGWNGQARWGGICSYRDQTNFYHKAKISVGCNNFNNVDWYFSDRQLVAMAAGTVHVCHYIPGLENIFTDGEHCVWYHTEEEAVAKIEWLLKDEAARQRIGTAGRDKVREEHTWDTRVLEYISLLREYC